MALYAFDGTWNDAKDAGVYGLHTNVVAFHGHYGGSKHVYKGVGTRHGRLGRFFGGAFGVGGRDRIGWARKDLAESFRNGDRDIDVVGFSRGAALALHFTNVVRSKGVRDPQGGEVLEPKPKIRFLGLWDTVASFGIPISLGPLSFQSINLGYRLKLPDDVERCYHALALDELRQTFRPTRIERAREVWFRGAHSDVGGGNQNPGLSNIALRWMLRKAAAAGVPVTAAASDDAGTLVDFDTPIRRAKMEIIPDPPRRVLEGDRIHYSVSVREGCCNPAEPWVRESEEEEAVA
jgi:uncharacterized protein (DUF2235 family)